MVCVLVFLPHFVVSWVLWNGFVCLPGVYLYICIWLFTLSRSALVLFLGYCEACFARKRENFKKKNKKNQIYALLF